MKTFAQLQAGLADAWALNRPGGIEEHVVVILPSFSLGESLLSHYADRIPALEHRYLVAQLMLHRIEGCEIVFLTCEAPGPEIVEYYLELIPKRYRASVRKRFRVFAVPDHSPRSIAAKLLDRPDLIEALRASFAGRPVYIGPWNVTKDEVDLALLLDAPLEGTPPELWPLGFKSAGRRLFASVGVPVPLGYEDLRTVNDIVAAIARIRYGHPAAPGVVIKLDNSGAGDGNVVVNLRDVPAGDRGDEQIRDIVTKLPDWYLKEMLDGGVVEELVVGSNFASPSVQVNISPSGEPEVYSTHEQLLGGESGQVYMGCRFPANPAYAADLANYGMAVGKELARRGAVGRVGLDFAAAQDPAGRWNVAALEINLRKGGTTHPFVVLRHLVPGRYDIGSGRWIAEDGSTRSYRSSDNLIDELCIDFPAAKVIKNIADAGCSSTMARAPASFCTCCLACG